MIDVIDGSRASYIFSIAEYTPRNTKKTVQKIPNTRTKLSIAIDVIDGLRPTCPTASVLPRPPAREVEASELLGIFEAELLQSF